MATPDMDVIKEIPGYKVILKAVLKSQIQQLVEQLASSTDEESVILTASVSDGILCHLGSDSGQAFLEDREEFKSEFLGFCLKRHHKKQQDKERLEAQKREEALARSMQAVTPPQYRNMGPQPGFMPRRSPRYHSPHQQQGLHPVGMTQLPGSPLRSTQNRYQPYSTVRPTRPALKSPQNINRQNVTPSKIDGQVIKIEPDDDATNQNANETSSVHTPSRTDSGVQDSSRSSSPAQKSSTPSRSQGPAPSDDDAKSDTSSSTIPNEASDLGISDTGPPGGLSLDSDLSNLISFKSETPQGYKSEPQTPVGLDPNVSVKLESAADSEMDLEITGVELGQGPSHSQQEWLGQMDNIMQGASGSSTDMGADLEPYSTFHLNDDLASKQVDDLQKYPVNTPVSLDVMQVGTDVDNKVKPEISTEYPVDILGNNLADEKFNSGTIKVQTLPKSESQKTISMASEYPSSIIYFESQTLSVLPHEPQCLTSQAQFDTIEGSGYHGIDETVRNPNTGIVADKNT